MVRSSQCVNENVRRGGLAALEDISEVIKEIVSFLKDKPLKRYNRAKVPQSADPKYS